MTEENWEYMKKMVENNEISRVVEMCNEMGGSEEEVVQEKLIQELRYTNEVCYRNTIAIILGDLKCNKAIDVLIELILDPQNENCRGTLIYALQALNCEHKLNRLMSILVDGNYEVKWNMYALLSEKRESMSEADKLNCINILKKEKARSQKATEFLEDILDNIFMYKD